MKRGILPVLILALLLFSITSFVSAEMSFNPLSSVYNIGDVINSNITLSSNKDVVDFLEASLICGVREIETHKTMESLSAYEEKRVTVIALIDENVVGPMMGECYLRATYNGGEIRSQPFKITNEVDIELTLDTAVFNPGENINISGIILKRNREPLNGFLELSTKGSGIVLGIIDTTELIEQTLNASENNETSNSTLPEEQPEELPQGSNVSIGSVFSEVRDGKFSLSFKLPENSPAGAYQISIYAYDTGKHNNIMNYGDKEATIRIRQVIKEIDIAFSSDRIVPDNTLSFTPIAYDQAKNSAESEIEVKIYKPNKSIFLEKVMKTGEQNSIFIESKFTSGFWSIETKLNEMSSSKLFFVEELRKINYSLSNGILTIENIGNVQFKGPIEIIIGNKTQTEQVNIALGENVKFRLKSPDGGEYEIRVGDGTTNYELGRAVLPTGNVIGIDNLNGLFKGNFSIWLWVLIIVILLIIALVLVRRFLKKKFVGKMPRALSLIHSKQDVPMQLSSPPLKQTLSPTTPSIENVTNSATKQEASVIALKIRNLSSLKSQFGDNSLDTIESALLIAKNAKAKIYIDHDYRVVIFVPMITNEKDNDMKAINTAKEMLSVLKDYNSIHSNKVDFGMGVHSGKVAIETHAQGKIKFVSIDNTLSIAKRIAESSKGEVLISEPLHKKSLGKIRVEKLIGTSFWQLKPMVKALFLPKKK